MPASDSPPIEGTKKGDREEWQRQRRGAAESEGEEKERLIGAAPTDTAAATASHAIASVDGGRSICADTSPPACDEEPPTSAALSPAGRSRNSYCFVGRGNCFEFVGRSKPVELDWRMQYTSDSPKERKKKKKKKSGANGGGNGKEIEGSRQRKRNSEHRLSSAEGAEAKGEGRGGDRNGGLGEGAERQRLRHYPRQQKQAQLHWR